MNSKKILGFSAAAVFAISIIFMGNAMASNGIPGHLDIKDWSVETHNGHLKAKFVTEDRIPKWGFKGGAFGFGMVFAADDQGRPENVLADTTHLCVSDSKKQNNALPFRCKDGIAGIDGLVPQEKWHKNEGSKHHAHNLDLKPQTDDCINKLIAEGKQPGAAALEVDLERTTGAGTYPNPNPSPNWPTYVFKNKAVIGNVPTSEIGDGSDNPQPGLVVAFEIIGIADANGNVEHLCLASITPAQSFR